MDDLRFYVFSNSRPISNSVISGRWEGDSPNERLCAVEPRLQENASLHEQKVLYVRALIKMSLLFSIL